MNTCGCALQVSVVIPTRNVALILHQCLDALTRCGAATEFEVILVDTGSTDDTIRIARSFTDRLRVSVLEQFRVTIAAARNAGARKARGTYLAFLDADCVPPLGWLDAILKTFDHTTAAVIGSRYAIPADSTWVARTWRRYQEGKIGRVSYLPGGDLIIRRAVFDSMGGFNESLETNEDYEICQRIIDQGETVESYPVLAVCHYGEAQTLMQFFRKQRWHGKHVIRVFMQNLPRLRNVRAITFAVYFAVCLLVSGAGALQALLVHRFDMLLGAITAATAAAVIASMRACVKTGFLADVMPLAALFFVFGVARASRVFDVGAHFAIDRQHNTAEAA